MIKRGHRLTNSLQFNFDSMTAEEGTIETDDFSGSDKEDSEDAPPASKTFNRGKHIKFFKHCLTMLPQMYQSIDSSRLTVLYFSLSGKFLSHH